MAGIKQRRSRAVYIDTTPTGATRTWVLAAAGFETLDDSPSAQVTNKKYVMDASASNSVTGYDWSSPFTADQIKGDEAIEFIKNIGEKELTGADALTNYMIVELDDPIIPLGTEYVSKIRPAVVEVSDFNNNEGDLQVNGNFLANGDWIHGKTDVAAPIEFTPIV